VARWWLGPTAFRGSALLVNVLRGREIGEALKFINHMKDNFSRHQQFASTLRSVLGTEKNRAYLTYEYSVRILMDWFIQQKVIERIFDDIGKSVAPIEWTIDQLKSCMHHLFVARVNCHVLPSYLGASGRVWFDSAVLYDTSQRKKPVRMNEFDVDESVIGRMHTETDKAVAAKVSAALAIRTMRFKGAK
jgi:hypothetical protein